MLYPRGLATATALQARLDLNGADVTCLAFHAESGRWAVEVHGTGERVRLKPANLLPGRNSWSQPSEKIDDSVLAFRKQQLVLCSILPKVFSFEDSTSLRSTCRSWLRIVTAHDSGRAELCLSSRRAMAPDHITTALRRCPLVSNVSLLSAVTHDSVLALAQLAGKRLRQLHFRGDALDRLTSSSVKTIASHCPRLLVLSMESWSMFTTQQVVDVEPVLRTASLIALDLSKNCSVETVEQIAQHCPTLRRLNINGACHVSQLAARFNDAVCALGAACLQLAILDAGETCMNESGLSGLMRCESLTSLSLPLVDEEHLTGTALGLIASMRQLQICDLSCNQSVSKECVLALLSLPNLRHLEVDGCDNVDTVTRGRCPTMDGKKRFEEEMALQKQWIEAEPPWIEAELPTPMPLPSQPPSPEPPSPEPCSNPSDLVGRAVEIRGLVSKPHLNGASAICLSVLHSGRCAVRVTSLPGGSKPIATETLMKLKPENVIPRGETASSSTNCTEMQTKWNFYHWNETKVNRYGESLRACMKRYGVGGWYSEEKDMIAALIFLSTSKTAADSWLLGIKHLNGNQEVARASEDDPNAYHLSPGTSLGAHITGLLEGSVFVKV